MTATRTLLWASVSDLDIKFQDDEVKALDALEYASFVLWALSGRSYTPETITMEAYDTTQSLARGSEIYPVLQNGSFYNVSACGDCVCSGCGIFHRTRLRGYPVRYIIDVWADGQLLPRDKYVLLDNAVLGLKSGCACAAKCLVVKYAYGSGTPPGGKRAAVKLAEQLLLSGQGANCQLPERVTSITRQGMSFTLLDPQDFLDKGRTGIYEIDLMLGALNPAHALKRARVFSPDIRRAETHSYAEPPISVKLDRGDQVVIPGSPAMLVSTDLDMITRLLNDPKHATTLATTLVDGTKISGQWSVVPGSGSATLALDAGQTAGMHDGIGYSVQDSNGYVELAGRVRTL